VESLALSTIPHNAPIHLQLENGLIRKYERRILVLVSLKEKILKRFHDSPYPGHLLV
jgi:hypothetical protein